MPDEDKTFSNSSFGIENLMTHTLYILLMNLALFSSEIH